MDLVKKSPKRKKKKSPIKAKLNTEENIKLNETIDAMINHYKDEIIEDINYESYSYFYPHKPVRIRNKKKSPIYKQVIKFIKKNFSPEKQQPRYGYNEAFNYGSLNIPFMYNNAVFKYPEYRELDEYETYQQLPSFKSPRKTKLNRLFVPVFPLNRQLPEYDDISQLPNFKLPPLHHVHVKPNYPAFKHIQLDNVVDENIPPFKPSGRERLLKVLEPTYDPSLVYHVSQPNFGPLPSNLQREKRPNIYLDRSDIDSIYVYCIFLLYNRQELKKLTAYMVSKDVKLFYFFIQLLSFRFNNEFRYRLDLSDLLKPCGCPSIELSDVEISKLIEFLIRMGDFRDMLNKYLK